MDEPTGLAATTALKVGEGAAGPRAGPLTLEEINHQGAEERQITGRAGLANQAAVLVLGAVATVVLAVLNGPMVASQSQQLVRGSLVGPATGDRIDDFSRGFDDAAFTDCIDPTLDTN
jgi:hypothetical protein